MGRARSKSLFSNVLFLGAPVQYSSYSIVAEKIQRINGIQRQRRNKKCEVCIAIDFPQRQIIVPLTTRVRQQSAKFRATLHTKRQARHGDFFNEGGILFFQTDTCHSVTYQCSMECICLSFSAFRSQQFIQMVFPSPRGPICVSPNPGGGVLGTKDIFTCHA